MGTDLEKEISLRPVTEEDHEFLLRAYAAGRETELAIFPFDDAQKRAFCEQQLDAQTAYYREKYPQATHEVILLDGEPVGRMYVNRGEKLILILDFAVLVAHRKQGIGTHIVKSLQAEAASSGKRVGVEVETFNPSQSFFRELGFKLVDSNEMSLYFEWSSL